MALLPILAMSQSETGRSHEVTIISTYDDLKRLRQANYNDGRQFEYTYDAAGNRLTQTIDPGPGDPVTTEFQYDIANRLIYVDSQGYTWDNNGNLLNDGDITYTYNNANRLASLSGNGIAMTTYRYNGMGDRLEQVIDMDMRRYTLDLAGRLTQVLSDGAHFYLYGDRRIEEEQLGDWQYHLNDGLGSVRQLTDQTGAVTLAKGYEPYGELLDAAGGASTAYGYTGEWTDDSGLVYLRARYYDPTTGRFMTRDPWGGNLYNPMTYNSWLYVHANPINYTDPIGLWRWAISPSTYHIIIENYYEGVPLNPNKQLEFYIPGTPRHRPDMFNSLLGDVYEIEPWFSEANALPQVQGYVTDLLSAAARGDLTKRYLGIIPTNWNTTPFHIGTGIDWPGKYRMIMPGFPMVDLVADYVGKGTILYWLEPNILAVVPFIVPNERLVKPRNWKPGTLAPQPATAITISEACGYTLVMVGGTIIVVTIVEDIATLGIGAFDDAITVPAGILFINFGLRSGVRVPVSVP